MPKAEIKLNLSFMGNFNRGVQDASLETVGALRTEIIGAQVIPKDQGDLEESTGAVDQFEQGDDIHTTVNLGDTAYARRLYFHPEYNFQTVNNPNAQGLWAQPWLPGGDLESFIPSTFARRMEDKLK